jgi:hypothetical protein
MKYINNYTTTHKPRPHHISHLLTAQRPINFTTWISMLPHIVLTCSCNMFCIWHMNFQELHPLIPNSFHFCPTSKFSSKLCRTFDQVKSTRLMMAFFCLGHINHILYTEYLTWSPKVCNNL